MRSKGRWTQTRKLNSEVFIGPITQHVKIKSFQYFLTTQVPEINALFRHPPPQFENKLDAINEWNNDRFYAIGLMKESSRHSTNFFIHFQNISASLS